MRLGDFAVVQIEKYNAGDEKMNRPFTKYVCDVCGEEVNVEDAMLQWLQKPTEESESHPFLEELEAIHICCNRKPCDSVYERRQLCEGLHELWDHLDSFVGSDGIDRLLVFPTYRKIPKTLQQDFLEIQRRLMVPYYEEARQYFSSACEDYFIEDLDAYKKGYQTWDQNTLKLIIEKYSKEKL